MQLFQISGLLGPVLTTQQARAFADAAPEGKVRLLTNLIDII